MKHDHRINIYDYLRSCVVRLEIGDSSGTGFFFAPGQIITCAHVISVAGEEDTPVFVVYQRRRYEAEVHFINPPMEDPELDFRRWPDIAWLSITEDQNDYLEIDLEDPIYDKGEENDKLMSSVYTKLFTELDHESTVAYFSLQGPMHLENLEEWKQRRWVLRHGQAAPGMSGAPLLNRRSGKIFGYVTRTRGEYSELGAWAISLKDVFDHDQESHQLAEFYHEKKKIKSSVLPPESSALGVNQRQIKICCCIDSHMVTQEEVEKAARVVEGSYPEPGIKIRLFYLSRPEIGRLGSENSGILEGMAASLVFTENVASIFSENIYSRKLLDDGVHTIILHGKKIKEVEDLNWKYVIEGDPDKIVDFFEYEENQIQEKIYQSLNRCVIQQGWR